MVREESRPTPLPPSLRIARLADRVGHEVSRPALHRPGTDRYVPVRLVRRDAPLPARLDQRARFLLAFVDDRTPVFELLAATGMPLDDGVEALVQLCEAELVGLRDPTPREFPLYVNPALPRAPDSNPSAG